MAHFTDPKFPPVPGPHGKDLSQQLQSLQLDKSTVLKYSTKEQLQCPKDVYRLFCPIISIDHLSQDFQDLPVDNILAIGDQALLHKVALTVGDGIVALLSPLGQPHVLEPITEPDVFGPLVDRLYSTLHRLEHRSPPNTRGPCEMLLYLSGHGMDPGNICLVPDGIKAHPARINHDLRDFDPAKWYKYDFSGDAKVEDYLDNFYKACAIVIGASRKPMGFVGGEVCAHQRGYIGVLGVLGLWCHAHSSFGAEDNVFHHLVIVADCCFAGIWGTTLERIVNSEQHCLQEYRELLYRYPVSIQCATSEFEASRGGVFTPIWYFMNTVAGNENLKKYHDDFLKMEPVSDDEFETQHPLYVSTSTLRPSWYCFDDPAFFGYLHGRQLQELDDDMQRGGSPTSPLSQPYVMALQSAASNQRKIRQVLRRQLAILNRDPGDVSAFRQSAEESIITTEQTLAALSSLLFQAAPRPQRVLQHYVIKGAGKPSDADWENRLRRANLADLLNRDCRDKLEELLPVCDVAKDIPPGVYVFQGGEGDMSLIVAPRQEEVILIDGTKTADHFKAAWNSTLRYLPRITFIVVTHHDEDHTFGIQLLLARYYVQEMKRQLPNYVEGNSLPDLSDTFIIMNTRAAFTCRNFWHEMEIETLVERALDSQVDSLIIKGKCVRLLNKGSFCLAAILPRQSLVKEVRGKVPAAGKETKPVSSRGGTTAANVLSINLVAVWNNRDAYLFTGDAHLKDVTAAALDFLADHPEIKSFKYVDVPHHGSAHSNITKVPRELHGLAGIPAEQYLISHCGNSQNPSFQTVKDILQSRECKVLHFLYRGRKTPPPILKEPPKTTLPAVRCQECNVGYKTTTANWHCSCISKEVQAKIKVPLVHYWEKLKYFPFADS